jgi:hypothetical protein
LITRYEKEGSGPVENKTALSDWKRYKCSGNKILPVKEFAAFKQRTLALINQSAEECYMSLLQSNPELLQYATLKNRASFVVITDASLSSIRKNFSSK